MLRLKSKHKIMCGDSTDKADVDKLMDGQKADMVFTDPPYGMNLDTSYKDAGYKDTNFKRKRHNHKKIIGDDKYFELPGFILDMAEEVFLWGADYYRYSLPEGGSFIVWDKRTSESGDRVIGSCFELCFSKKKHKRDIARILWCGVYGHDKNDDGKGKVHPTMKPVKLAEWFFERWGKDKTLIVDLFLGSGSTLIACEKTNRQCYGMEISEHYVSVILKRYEEYTGKEAVKWSDEALN